MGVKNSVRQEGGRREWLRKKTVGKLLESCGSLMILE